MLIPIFEFKNENAKGLTEERCMRCGMGNKLEKYGCLDVGDVILLLIRREEEKRRQGRGLCFSSKLSVIDLSGVASSYGNMKDRVNHFIEANLPNALLPPCYKNYTPYNHSLPLLRKTNQGPLQNDVTVVNSRNSLSFPLPCAPWPTCPSSPSASRNS